MVQRHNGRQFDGWNNGAQRLTASEDGAGGTKRRRRCRFSLVLNALRHQRMVQNLAMASMAALG